MGHHHEHHHHVSGKNIGIAILLNLLISVLQFVGGLFSGSISLLTDALHNFSDVLALLLSFFTNKLAKKNANNQFTFGYKRAEILSTFVNAITLIVIALFLIYESVKRLIYPEEIQADWVIYFALGSILINVLSVVLLHNDAKNNMNMKSAYLHLLTDVMTSFAVLFGGVMMKYFYVYFLDSILSIFIAFYLIYSSFPLIKSSVNILMQAVPSHINLQKISKKIKQINEVITIDNLYFWQLNDKEYVFSVNVKIDNFMNAKSVKNEIQQIVLKYINNYQYASEVKICISVD